MSYERWAKRMDDAVASTWLRGLRSQDRLPPARRLTDKARATKPLGKLERPIATAER
jgi:hypothetical protein